MLRHSAVLITLAISRFRDKTTRRHRDISGTTRLPRSYNFLILIIIQIDLVIFLHSSVYDTVQSFLIRWRVIITNSLYLYYNYNVSSGAIIWQFGQKIPSRYARRYVLMSFNYSGREIKITNTSQIY